MDREGSGGEGCLRSLWEQKEGRMVGGFCGIGAGGGVPRVLEGNGAAGVPRGSNGGAGLSV